MKYAVYGTLRLNQGNYNWCLKNKEGVKHLETKKIKGYRMFSLGGFPGVKEDENSEIIVDIFDVNNENVVRNLDGLEGYRENDERNSMYLKRKTDNDEFIYVWNRRDEGVEEIFNGDWVEFKKNKQYV